MSGLGRGLAALIPDSALELDAEQGAGRLRVVPLDEIRPNPQQPRSQFKPAELEALAASVRQHGVLSPLMVRRQDGHYILVAGERRLRAAGLAGLHEVPVLVHDSEGEASSLELALVENLQRSDLDPIEAAKGFQALIESYDYTQEQVAVRVGKKRATVANALRLLRLPEAVREAVSAGMISAGHARALVPLIDSDQLRSALRTVINRGLNVRATESLVRRLLADTRNPPLPRDPGLSYATSLLSTALHTSVEIKPLRRGGGRIVIDYADAEDLDRLVQALKS